MQIISLSVIFIVIGIFGVSCTSQSKLSENRTFEFSSGGACHPQGFGEWQVRLTGDGTFSIVHNVAGEITAFGPFALTEQENSRVWELVQAAQLDNTESTQRPGVPDEVQYTFALTDNAETHTIKIWINDARKNDKIIALVDGIGFLIELHTKTKPVLK